MCPKAYGVQNTLLASKVCGVHSIAGREDGAHIAIPPSARVHASTPGHTHCVSLNNTQQQKQETLKSKHTFRNWQSRLHNLLVSFSDLLKPLLVSVPADWKKLALLPISHLSHHLTSLPMADEAIQVTI